METEQVAVLAQTILEVLGEPFQTVERFVNAVTYGVKAYTLDLNSKTALPYMMSSLLIAWMLYRRDYRLGRVDRTVTFRSFLCPREIYLHRSALADYKYAACDLSIKLLLYTPLFSAMSWVLYKAIRSALEPVGFDVSSMTPFALAFMPGVVGFLFADFGFFFSHYLMHKVPLLWVFHEVHHSAEVLTPVTVHRVHPVEDLVNALVGSTILAATAATYSALSSQDVGLATIFGVNVLYFLFYVCAFQLRHSHVWLSYGPVLSRILISPAQHQIHHSVEGKHWNKNFGFTLAFWDLLFGSLYVPRSRETLRVGLPYGDPLDYTSVWKLYFLPFVKAARLLKVKRQDPRNREAATL
jgi:sterol desaturase/sphingolipid hydroxylase (fatty acid hydroxylase superfamily)